MKSRLSIELVARDNAQLDSELHRLSNRYSEFCMVNIPDLMRFSVRSWQGCAQAKQYVSTAIPHLRSIDFDLSRPWALKEYLLTHQLLEVLVIRGDPPADGSRQCFDTTSLEMIEFIKRELPNIKVYAAIDPYRSSLEEEISYAREKLGCGVDGFFTQPFFDLHDMARYRAALRELSPTIEIFWGVSPVIGSASQKYWQRVNSVVFPSGFKPDLQWNKTFAVAALQWLRARDESVYFMPVKVDLEEYFSGILF